MTMSRDRIEFVLSSNDREFNATVAAACRAFGIRRDEAYALIRNSTTVRCRPSQFGRFIVYRIEEGVTINQVKHLEPKIIKAEVVPTFVDLTGNRHAE